MNGYKYCSIYDSVHSLSIPSTQLKHFDTEIVRAIDMEM